MATCTMGPHIDKSGHLTFNKGNVMLDLIPRLALIICLSCFLGVFSVDYCDPGGDCPLYGSIVHCFLKSNILLINF